MNKKIWEWMCKNTPGALVLYYTARGRTDSDQMKRVLQDIEIKKENKKIKKNLIPLQQPSPTQDAAQPSPKVMPAASKPVPKSAEKSVVKPMPATTIPPISKPITPTPVAEIPSIKLPYLEGSESVSLKRPEAIVFARELLLYDVISFDIFDTLLLRPFAKPTDLFMILGNKYNLMNFSKIRMDSEKEAREIRKVLYNNTEITLEDIYEIVEKKTGIKKEVGIQVEFETEMEFCFANPYIQRVYKLLKSKGKRMIACSDMYIPKEYMQKLLEKCGYTDFEEIYVSCDYNCSKRSKGLYDIVLSKLKKDEKMVHIGDNHTTDILHAEEKGIKTKHYKNVHEAGNKYRADGMSELVGSVYSGIVNTYLHNGIKKYNPYYEFGFIYGGFYVLGFYKAKARDPSGFRSFGKGFRLRRHKGFD